MSGVRRAKIDQGVKRRYGIWGLDMTLDIVLEVAGSIASGESIGRRGDRKRRKS